MAKDVSGYGVIQEQGDMGLGFNPLSGSEKETVEKHKETQEAGKSSKNK